MPKKQEDVEVTKTPGTEVTFKNQNAPAVAEIPHIDEWGTQEISSQDIIISKVFPMQAMSKKVSEDQAKFGELRDSVSNDYLGSITEPMEFIPIMVKRLWIESELAPGTKDFKYKRSVEITAANEGLRYDEDLPGGAKLKRVKTFNAYVLLPKEIDSLPKIISFKVTSMRAGQKLQTQMLVTNRMAKLSPAALAMNLTLTKQKNDKGTFVVMDVVPSRQATAAEQRKALDWYKTLTAKEDVFKEDNSDLGETAAATDFAEYRDNPNVPEY